MPSGTGKYIPTSMLGDGTADATTYLAGDQSYKTTPTAVSVDDAPVNGETTHAISSNWAFDHVAAADPHTGYAVLVGRAGGQVFQGGTAAGDKVTIQATSHGTPTAGNLISGGDDHTVEVLDAGTSTRVGLIIKHTTSGVMVDNFGAQITFQARDDSGANNTLGRMSFDRNGADNTGDFVVRPVNAGSGTERFRVSATGDTTVTGGFIKSTSPTGGIGYAGGAGGTVTQATSKSTAVTLDKVCGQITLNNATLNAGTEVTFTVTNSTVATTDCVVVNHDSVGTAGAYLPTAHTIGSGSFQITVSNLSASNLGEAIVLNFVVIKAVAT